MTLSGTARPTRGDELRARFAHSVARDVLVAGASAAVVALLVGFALAGPSPELTASVGPVVPRPGGTAIVEGRVLEAAGGGLEGAEVVVRRLGATPARTWSDENGAFRMSLRGGCASYLVVLRAEVQGEDLDSTSRRRLCPGDSLPVDARVTTQGHFLWVPGPR